MGASYSLNDDGSNHTFELFNRTEVDFEDRPGPTCAHIGTFQNGSLAIANAECDQATPSNAAFTVDDLVNLGVVTFS